MQQEGSYDPNPSIVDILGSAFILNSENPASISILPTTIFGPLFSFSGGRVHNIGLKYVVAMRRWYFTIG